MIPVPSRSENDAVRSEILKLFGQCNHDVPLLLDRIARVLQDSGRTDLRFESSANGGVVTVSQDARYTSRERPFLANLEARLDPTRVGGLPEPKTAVERAYQAINELDRRASKDSQSSLSGDMASTLRREAVYPQPAPYRSFPRTLSDEKLESFPTSRYNGNYLLRRYGCAFPPYGRYEFYRQYGAAGQGARTAEYHNRPNGLFPATLDC